MGFGSLAFGLWFLAFGPNERRLAKICEYCQGVEAIAISFRVKLLPFHSAKSLKQRHGFAARVGFEAVAVPRRLAAMGYALGSALPLV
jgi:hypothetical protein